MVCHWSLSDNKPPQVSRTLLSTLADPKKAVVLIVSTCPLIFNSSCTFTHPLTIVLSTPITTGVTVTFIFHSLFSSLARSWYLFPFSLSFNFTLWSAGAAKSTIGQVLFLGLVVWPRLSDSFVSHIIIIIIIFTNPSARTGYDTRSIFKWSLTGLNSEFSFSWTGCLTKAEEPSLPYYLPIAGGGIFGFIPFPRVLVLCEMQSVSFRI